MGGRLPSHLGILNELEEKGVCSAYTRPAVTDEEHETLTNETCEILGVIMGRIKYENEPMFPLISDT